MKTKIHIALIGFLIVMIHNNTSFAGKGILAIRDLSLFTDTGWVDVGTEGFSPGSYAHFNLCFGPDCTPYVAYAEMEATVKKFDGFNWINVGQPRFSGNWAGALSLAIGPDGEPYLAYRDGGHTWKASVMKFDGINWVYVGSPGFSPGNSINESLAFDPVSGQPYLAFIDLSSGPNITSVMRFDGTSWIYVGIPGFTIVEAISLRLAFGPSNQPYLAYSEYLTSHKISVMKYDGTNWVYVGTPAFASIGATPYSLVFSSSGQPHIGFTEGGSNSASVMKFDGTNWVYVGSPAFSIGGANHPSLAFSPSGQLYVAFGDVGNSSKATCMKYDSTNWIYVGIPGFSNGFVQYSNMAFNETGQPFVGFVDLSLGPKAAVKSYTPLAEIVINLSGDSVCEGDSVTFTATSLNGGLSPSYQWKVNGVNKGNGDTSYTYIPLNGDSVICLMNSTINCTFVIPVYSNKIHMTVNPKLPVMDSIVASSNPSCQGMAVTFTSYPVNGGTNPSYTWKVNGIVYPIDSSSFQYIPSNNDTISCTIMSDLRCTTNNPANSNTVIMTVNPLQSVRISVTASQNPVCAGTSVTYTATHVNGGTSPVYQWKVNGVNVGMNNPEYTYIPVNGDLIWCTLTSSEICTTGNPATSTQIQMVVNNNQPVGISVTANPIPFCPGVSVSFNATPMNGGTSPIYQWKVNGNNTGMNSPTYSYSAQPNDSVWCMTTSNLSCVSGNPATSNKIMMIASPVPVVTFTRCFDSVTVLNAKPIKLKGGIPLGGTYSGLGVNSATGIYTPSSAGIGIKTITYTYTNVALCSAIKIITITIQATSSLTCGNNFPDIRDGKKYPTIQIGSQCWMAANLNYGTMILSSTHQRDNCVPEKYCYHDLTGNCQLGTSTYQWDELMLYDDSPGLQGLCPPGWHVPTEAEWNTLFSNWTNNALAGAPLKYSGYSGFDALLSGVRHLNVQWDYRDFATFFWSSTPYKAFKAWSHGMNDYDPSVAAYPSLRTNAFSVRCIKD